MILPRRMFAGLGLGEAVPESLARYIRVNYATMKTRCKQLYEYRGEWEWQFVAALATVESGLSYKASTTRSDAYGLFGIKKVAADYIRVSHEDMKKSVPLQLRAGKKLLADYRSRIKSAFPDVLAKGGDDLYAITYMYHNLGIGAAPILVKKAQAAGKSPTWANLKSYVSSAHVEVINRLISLVPKYAERYAELILGQKSSVASAGTTQGANAPSAFDEGSTDTGADYVDLQYELSSNEAEDDGEVVPIPASLDDYGPEPLPDGTLLPENVTKSRAWLKWLLLGTIAVGALAGGTYVLVRASRKQRGA